MGKNHGPLNILPVPTIPETRYTVLLNYRDFLVPNLFCSFLGEIGFQKTSMKCLPSLFN